MTRSIEVNNLTFSYNQVTVLKDINFQIEKGKIVTIIGPNGSGKSTLLKNLASILSPQKGSIVLDNRKLWTYPTRELARKLAIVPQNINIEYDFTCYEIVLMGRTPYIKRFQQETFEDLAIVKDVMEKTRVWHLKNKSVRELSGGEYQRVIIAKALAQNPQTLLLDEPTATLDIHHQIEILDLLKLLNKEKGITIIMALHDINLAVRYSDEIILINGGTKVAMGSPEEIITKDNLQGVYKTDIIVDKNKHTSCPEVIALSNLK